VLDNEEEEGKSTNTSKKTHRVPVGMSLEGVS
jgi:hypothetical protein